MERWQLLVEGEVSLVRIGEDAWGLFYGFDGVSGHIELLPSVTADEGRSAIFSGLWRFRGEY